MTLPILIGQGFEALDSYDDNLSFEYFMPAKLVLAWEY